MLIGERKKKMINFYGHRTFQLLEIENIPSTIEYWKHKSSSNFWLRWHELWTFKRLFEK